jgi:hypothetical protein
MDRIRDLTDTDGRDDELLTSTSGGVFDTQYLSGEPPASSLKPSEQPQYVLRNKKSGVKRTGEGTESAHSPDGDYQALAVVTDCRVCFFIGHADGDWVESVDHDEIVEARAESRGFMTSALLVERVDGQCVRFPCRGDVSAVAAYVDDAAQTWATASRLIDEANGRLDASRESLDEGEFADARRVLADVSDDIESARNHVSMVGDGAAAELESRANGPVERLRQLEGEIAATKGAHHHALAQEAWKTDHDFERAAREYERGAKGYERALASDGETPPEEALQLRLKGLLRERAILRAAPMADARAAREVALATDDSEEAATQWETALTCYREAATLDWGEHDGEFFVKRERARERAGEAATEALDAHIEAGQEWITAGDKIVRNGRQREAGQAYERAGDHFHTAREIARELQPSRLDEIDEQLRALETREDGEVVSIAEPDEPTLSVDTVTAELTGDDRHVRTAKGATRAPETDDGSDTTPTPAIQRVTSATAESTTATPGPSDRLDGSVEYTPAIRRRPPDNEAHTPASDPDAATTETPTDERAEPVETPVDGSQRAVSERETLVKADDEPQAASGPEQESTVTGETLADAGQNTPVAEGETTNVSADDLHTALEELDGTGLAELVADLWEAQGWSTTVFSAQTQAVYDVLAFRTRDGKEERLLLWTAHRPDGGTVGETVIRRCATTRDSSRGADGATLVTTGTLTTAARQQASDREVTVVDRDALLERLVSAGLAEQLLQ